MLATLSEPFDADGWLYEIKWDGYRAIAMMQQGEVSLHSRNHISYNRRFYPIYNAIQGLHINAVLDGEIVVRNKDGRIDFNALQNWQSERDGTLLYYVFDLLWLDGYDLTQFPLEQRRTLLRDLLRDTAESSVKISENLANTATELLEAVSQLGLEGIIAKKSGSFYYPGERSTEWLKMKRQKRQEVVIGGYVLLNDSPKPFSSLLIGVYEKGKFRYVGKVGTGFSVAMQKKMLLDFEPFIQTSNPFEIIPVESKPVHFRPRTRGQTVKFLAPELVCEVYYSELTSDRLLRHPAFISMRTDKIAQEVVQELEIPAEKSNTAKHINDEHMAHKPIKKLLLEEDNNVTITVNKQELKFTNLDKFYWADEKITKRDLINYYHQVAGYMLPYLKNRPMSLHRHPNGFASPSFYQKDVKGKAPEWIETLVYRSEEEPDIEKEFMVCTDEASLLYMANLGCIEMNPWNSTTQHPDQPDWCVLDFDPDKNNTFEQVITVAKVAHSILEAADITCLCKTSGSTGLHIYIPLNSKYTYDQSQDFAQLICTLIQRELPKITSLERPVNKRKGKIYLDFLQNKTQATLAAPYSVRPKPGAPVSMPLHWDEVQSGLEITDYTIYNAIDLLQTRGDLFKAALGKGIDMKAALHKLEEIWKEE